jgi:hypothetical protein
MDRFEAQLGRSSRDSQAGIEASNPVMSGATSNPSNPAFLDAMVAIVQACKLNGTEVGVTPTIPGGWHPPSAARAVPVR